MTVALLALWAAVGQIGFILLPRWSPPENRIDRMIGALLVISFMVLGPIAIPITLAARRDWS